MPNYKDKQDFRYITKNWKYRSIHRRMFKNFKVGSLFKGRNSVLLDIC